MSRTIKDFVIHGIRGEGAYGVVYTAQEKSSGVMVAIKEIRFEQPDEGVPVSALREIAFLHELRHQHIVKLYDIIVSKNTLYLILELVGSDLSRKIRNTPSTTRLHDALIMYQILNGVAFCHKNRVVHRDLKPSNILVFENGWIKLADFGLARAFQIPVHTYTHDVVTLWYRAPEILLGEDHYTPAVDMWSVGCIFAEILLRKVFLQGDSEIGQIYKIFEAFGTPNDLEDSWPGVRRLKHFKDEMPHFKPQLIEKLIPCGHPAAHDLLKRMFVYCPLRRITASAALRHPYFDGIAAKIVGPAEVDD